MFRSLHYMLLFASFVIGCDDTEQREVNQLEETRILGIALGTNGIDLASPSSSLPVSLYVHREEDMLEYTWTLCPSLGSLTRFECLSPELEISGQSALEDFTIEVPNQILAPASLTFLEDIEAPTVPQCIDGQVPSCNLPEECPSGSLCVEEKCFSPTELYPVQVALKVKTVDAEGRLMSAARNVPIFVGDRNNQQIKLASIETVDELTTRAVEDERCANAFSVEPTAKTVKLRAIIDPETLDTYSVLDGENCSMMHEEDSYFVSWFTTAGELKRIFSDDVDIENELTLDKTAARTQIYVVARDGRGTLDFHCVEFFQMGAQPLE